MLQDYKEIFRKEPRLLLRFIDDVVIVWTGSEVEFNHFNRFCNECASSKGYKSKMEFTSSRPLKAKIEVHSNRTLSADLFCELTTSFQYLQHNSYHPAHMTTSLPKSQFMRIRQICSYIKNYDKHTKQFINYAVLWKRL